MVGLWPPVVTNLFSFLNVLYMEWGAGGGGCLGGISKVNINALLSAQPLVLHVWSALGGGELCQVSGWVSSGPEAGGHFH